MMSVLSFYFSKNGLSKVGCLLKCFSDVTLNDVKGKINYASAYLVI